MRLRYLDIGGSWHNPLWAHDVLLLRIGFAANFRSWRDWLFLAFASAATMLWLRDVAGGLAALGDPRLSALLAAILAIALSRKLAARLAYHSSEGVLAAEGLTPRYRRLYRAAWFTLAAAALALLGLIVEAIALLPLMAGYVAGIAIAQIPFRLALPRGRPEPGAMRPGRLEAGHEIFPLLTKGTLGYGAKATRSAAVIAAGALATGFGAALAGRLGNELVETFALAILALACLGYLTRLDHATVRFLALTGHGPWRSLGVLMAPTALYAAILLPLAAALLGTRGLLVAALAGSAAGALMAARISAYRVHDKVRADTLLTLAFAGVALLGTTFPPLLLVAIPALAVHLLRRSKAATWRMA